VVLCVFQKPPEQKPDSLLSRKFPSLQSFEYRRSSFLRSILLQRALEFRKRSLILLRYLPEQPLPSSCGLVPPLQSKLLCRKSSSKRKSSAKVHPDRRHFEIIRVENEFQIKNKPQAGSYKIQIYPMNPFAALPNLVSIPGSGS
jgi:hypothetical protein